MSEALSRDELLDWLAAYSISPWGEERADMRAVVGSSWPWDREKSLRVTYPYVPSDTGTTSEEDELEAIEQLEAIRAKEQSANGDPN